MGLRGPGAKPLKRAVTAPVEAPEALPWEKKGLTRLARVIAFLEFLPITAGVHAGKPFKVRTWQRKFLAKVYHTEAGSRPVRTAVLSMARKNGKSDIAARLALCHLSGPEAEPRGEVYSAANDRFQASRIFSEMAAMIAAVPFLDGRISLKRHDKTMEDFENGSVFASLSADVATKHGLSPSMIVYDELGQAPNRHLFDALDTAMGARAEPLMVVISTQAANDLAPMSELIDYGLKVSAGEVDDKSFHLTFYRAPDDADPWAKATWLLANPALGDFRSLDDVERMAAQAKRLPTKESAFRNLILNQRVSSDAHLIPRSEWVACNGPVDIEALKGRPCFAGLDLGGARDLTALVLVFPGDDGVFDVLPMFFVPEKGLQDREDQERVPYGVWRDQGLVQMMPGRTMDPRYVAQAVAELHSQYGIKRLAFDRWKIDDFKRELETIGVTDLDLVPHGQGWKEMGPAVDNLLRLVSERLIRHGGNPALTMCIANAKPSSDPAGNLKLDKVKSTGRIDGAVALAMALNAARQHVATPEWVPFVDVVA
jgi:phage terminase large subunit-like protein